MTKGREGMKGERTNWKSENHQNQTHNDNTKKQSFHQLTGRALWGDDPISQVTAKGMIVASFKARTKGLTSPNPRKILII